MSGQRGTGFARVFERELDHLAEEIRSYPDEASIWAIKGRTKNSAGTLALHIVGNLQHFVSAKLGDSGYIRDRDAEFGERDVPREQILARIESCKRAVSDVLGEIDDEALAEPYPGDLPGPMAGASTEGFLLHLLWHLGWHLGQIDYHRRIPAGG